MPLKPEYPALSRLASRTGTIEPLKSEVPAAPLRAEVPVAPLKSEVPGTTVPLAPRPAPTLQQTVTANLRADGAALPDYDGDQGDGRPARGATLRELYPDGLPTTTPSDVVVDRSQDGREEPERNLREKYYDVAEMARGVKRAKLRQLRKAEEAQLGRPLTGAEDHALWVRAKNEAHQEVRREIDSADNASAVFYDSDPEGTTADLARRAEENPLFRAVSPLAAWFQPYTHRTYRPEKAELRSGDETRTEWRSEYGDSYNRQGAWGWLQWIGQAAPSAFMATAAAAGQEIRADDGTSNSGVPFLRVFEDAWKGWGTEEHLDAIRRGEEMTTHAEAIGSSIEGRIATNIPGLIGGAVAENVFEVTGMADSQEHAKRMADTLNGVGISLAVALVEPDLIFFATAGMGKAARLGRQGVDAVSTLPRLSANAGMMEDGARQLRAVVARNEVPADRAAVAAGKEAPNATPLADSSEEGALLIERLLRELPPEIRSSVDSHIKARFGWSPALSHSWRSAARASRAADERLDRVRVGLTTEAERAAREAPTNPPSWEAFQGTRRARTAIAEMEWNAEAQRHYANTLLKAELEARISLAERITTKGNQALDAAGQQKLTADAQAAWDETIEARRAMLTAADEAEFLAAEERLVQSMARFRDTTTAAVDEMGHAGIAGLRAALADADTSASNSLLRLRNLTTLMTQGEAQGLIHPVRGALRPGSRATALDNHIKRVEGLGAPDSAMRMARGQEMLSTVADVLEGHATSYRALHGAIRSGSQDDSISTAQALQHLDPYLRRGARDAAGNQTFDAGASSALWHAMTGLFEEDVLQAAISGDRLTEPVQEFLLALRERALSGNTTDVVVPPNVFRDSLKSLANTHLAHQNLPTGIAKANELRRPWIEYASSAHNASAMERSLKLGMFRLQRFAQKLANPTLGTLGPSEEGMRQIAKGGMDAQRVGLFEITELARHAGKVSEETGRSMNHTMRAQTIAYADSVDGSGLPNGFKSVLAGTGTGSMWQQARASMMQMLEAADDAHFQVNAFDALVRMWLPKGEEAAAMVSGLTEKARELLDESESFEAFAKGMQIATASRMSSDIRGSDAHRAAMTTLMQSDGQRAYGMAVQAVMQQAVLARMTKQVAAETMGFSRESMRAAMAITEGLDARAGGAWEEAMGWHARAGLPPKLRELAADTMMDMRAGLIMLEKQGEGVGSIEAALIPRQWMHAMDEQMAKIIKRTDSFNTASTNPVQRLMGDTLSRLWRLWRTSITTGVLWHSPRYMVAMMAGNLAQIFTDPVGGMKTAIRSTAQMGTYAAAHGPFSPLRLAYNRSTRVRAALDGLHARAVDQHGQDSALGSAVGAMWNPHVAAFFDPARATDEMTIHTQSGDVVTMGWLREQALKEGVLTSYASTELKELLARGAGAFDRDIYAPLGTLRKAKEGYKKGGLREAAQAAGQNLRRSATEAATSPLTFAERRAQSLADYADSIEQRQRAALFLDHIVNRGYTPAEAGKLVRESLYDWGHALSEEEQALNNMVLFWRFWKVMMRQGVRTLGDGLLRGYNGENLVQMGKNTATGRLRAMTTTLGGMREVAGTEDDEMAALREEKAWMMSQVYPGWSMDKGTPMLANHPMDDAEMMMRRDITGRKTTHVAYSMPSLTPMDSAAMLIAAMATMARIAGGQSSVGEGALQAGMQFASMGSPVTQKAMEGVLEGFMGNQGMEDFGTPMRLRESEKLILGARDRALAGVGLDSYFEPWVFYQKAGQRGSEKDRAGVARASAPLVRLMRILPIVATEIPYWVDPALQAHDRATYYSDPEKNEVARELVFMARQWTGILKEYAHDPQGNREFTMSQLQKKKATEVAYKDRQRWLLYSEDRDMRGQDLDESR